MRISLVLLALAVAVSALDRVPQVRHRLNKHDKKGDMKKFGAQACRAKRFGGQQCARRLMVGPFSVILAFFS